MPRLDDFHDMIYFHSNRQERFVFSFGYTFEEFYQTLNEPNFNILLLKHSTDEGDLHLHTLLPYVLDENLEGFIARESYKNGPLCWIDFDDLSNLDLIEGQELAELLYLGHIKKHLRTPFYQTLNNQYVFLSDEGQSLIKMYYRNFDKFYDFVSKLLSLKLSHLKMPKSWIPFRRKIEYPPIDEHVIKKLDDFFSEGMILSLKYSTIKRNKVQIPFWNVGDVASIEGLEEEYEKASNQKPNGYITFDKDEWYI